MLLLPLLTPLCQRSRSVVDVLVSQSPSHAAAGSMAALPSVPLVAAITWPVRVRMHDAEVFSAGERPEDCFGTHAKAHSDA
jgi:hypothetical protein